MGSQLSSSALLRATLLMLIAATTVAVSTRLMRPSPAIESAAALPKKPQSTKAEVMDQYGKLPLSFERNEGQTDREVKFLSRGPGYDLYLTATDAVLTLRKPRPPANELKQPSSTEHGSGNQPPEASVVRLKMIGANSQSQVKGEEPLPGKINYLVGNDPQKWHVNIPTYRKVYYTEIYPKVDLVYYGNQRELEYDFVVAPGGDVQAIGFQLEGADGMRLDDAGNLQFAVKHGEVTLRKPVIYQLTDEGDRREVNGEYVISDNKVRFNTGAFDAHKPLIIDPVLSYSTLLGGASHEFATGIAVDSAGSAYVTGSTGSSAFPTTVGAFQTVGSSFGNAFVTKLDPTGSSLVYSTYLSGSDGAAGAGVAIDSSGHAYVTGTTDSSDFPTVNPIRSSTSNFYKSVDSGGEWNGHVIGPARGPVNALAVDPLAPSTMYAGMGQPSGIHKSTDGGGGWTSLNTGLINPSCRTLVLDPSNPSTIYASLTQHGVDETSHGLYKSTDGGGSWTLLSNGLVEEIVTALAIDPSSPTTIYAGRSFVGVSKSTDGGASWTNSSTGITFGGTSAIAIDPVTPQTVYLSAGGGGVFKSTNGGANWGQVNTGLTATTVRTLTIDPSSHIYAGTSGGGVFKSTNGGGNWTPTNNGISGNIQVSSVALGSSASTTLYLGTGDGRIFKTVDGGNNWTKVFETLTRTNFSALAINPVTSSTVYAGANISGGSLNDDEGFVSKLNPDGSGLVYSTYLGGNGDDFSNGIAVDSTGSVTVVGQTASSSFPTVNAFQSTLSGSSDAFVTRFNAAGDALLYSTYLGGNFIESAFGVAVDGAANAYVTGHTLSANFPTLNPFQSVFGGSFDAFATKLSGIGAPVYSTYLGGEGSDTGHGIAVDLAGSAYITGLTTSSSFPTANPIQSTNGGAAGDAFVTKVNPTGSGLIYSTFLGGSGVDGGHAIAVDSAGNAFVAGFTGSADFPLVAGALKTKSPFFKSTDGGSNWNNNNYGLLSDKANVLALDPSSPSTIYAGTLGNVFKSTDGGQSWNSSSTGLMRPNVLSVVVDPKSPTTIYLGSAFAGFGDSTGVYKSTDAGNTWNAANNGLTDTSVLSLAIDSVTPSTLYAGVNGGGIFKSVNAGANWTFQAGATLFSIEAIVVDPITPTTIYAGANSSPGGISKSTDGGVTWQPINTGLTTSFIRSLAIDPLTPSTIYAGTNGGLFKSTDGGAGWTSIGTGLPVSFINAIAIDPITTTTLYASSSGFTGGVFKSVDGGNNWTPVNNGLTYRFASSVVVNPIRPANVYAVVEVFPFDDDAFVAKLNPSGSALVYSTLLGGSTTPDFSFFHDDEGRAIALDSMGNAYVAGFSHSPDFPVTPKSFQPFNRGFSDAFVSKLTMSYIISGHVRDGNNAPVSGADVTLSDGASVSLVVTEDDGAYQFSHLREGGNFTVSAAKPTFTMAPPSQSFNNLQSNQTADFIATPTGAPFYSISGTITSNGVPLGGVPVTLSGSQQGIETTNSSGVYSFSLAGGGNYTITPSILGFTFAPASQSFNNLSADQTADFAATRQDFVVTNTNDHGSGSLRQAILNANATVGLDTIAFNIPGSGVRTIALQFGLPVITDPVLIDGTTQPGFSGTPLIQLDGLQAGSSAGGLRVNSSGSTIRGLAIGRFDGFGIILEGNGGNTIQGNYVGTDSSGALRRSNGGGIAVQCSNNLIGGSTAGSRNVVSANDSGGISLAGSNNVVQGNFIGTDASGTVALGNGSYGLQADTNSSQPGDNLIGGTSPAARNIISGNDSFNLVLRSTGNIVQGNFIGTDLTGTVELSINASGVKIEGVKNVVGGTTAEARNIISGNGGDGVLWNGFVDDSMTRIQGNFIGTDVTGQKKVGNGTGISIRGPSILIGGTSPGAGNLISGNDGAGVELSCCSGGHIVQGNLIGTDITGSIALGNLHGMTISTSSNLIGGLTPGAQNIISGNNGGIQISGGSGNTIQGNIIGLNGAGNAPLPNSSTGISISSSSNNMIGGTEGGAGNRISFNGGPGVSAAFSTGNSILRNSIFSNGGLGIDLSPNGITANDPGDVDAGANNLQNFPLITSVASNGSTTTIQGTLNSKPDTSFRIDFYSSSACDPSGNGEGARVFDTTDVTTDANGNASINFTSSVALAAGRVITATATDQDGNTSEFSPCDSSSAIGNLQFTSATYKVIEDVGNAVITVIRVGGSQGTLSVDYSTADGSATAGADYTAVSGTLVFADGETVKTFIIPVANEGGTEADETVQLALTVGADLEALGNPVTAMMIIQDISTPLLLTMNSIDVLEGDSGNTNAGIVVILGAQTGRTITADYNTSAVTATSGVDFVAASGSLTFPPTVTTQGITVSVIGDTIGELNESFRVLLSNPVNALIGSFSTVRILDDDRPTITTVAVSRQRGSPAGNSTIANVTDRNQALDTLVVTVNGGASSTSSGVTVSNISVNAAGVVTADVVASCTANTAGFNLTVTDNSSSIAFATLLVTVTANSAPTVGNYPDSGVSSGGTITVMPTVAPSDNNSVNSVTAVADPATFTGSFSGDTSTGGVTITGANPPGTYTVTVTLTDNCAATTTRSFPLTVSLCGPSLSKASHSFAANGGADTFSVVINAGCSWTAVSNNPDWITITSGANGTGNGTVTYSVSSHLSVNSRMGTITVAGLTFTVNQAGIAAVGLSSFKTDFDSDGKTEIGFYRAGLWGFLRSSQSYSFGAPQFFSWGGAGQQPFCADFDGDGKADIANMVPPSGGQSAAYAILKSTTGYDFGQALFVSAGFPSLGDTPVVGDFDGDGKADPGIWRASQGAWIIPLSSSNYTSAIFTQWGQLGDTPVVADFDGDDRADIGFYRNGLWGVLKSTQSYSFGSAQFFSWGGAGLQPIVGDFDADSKADIAYITPPASGQSAAYSILKSSTGYDFGQALFVPAGFPSIGDTPVVGDYDGDGKDDPGIWRESQGAWIIALSSSNYASHIFTQWGQSGDIVFPNSIGKH